MMAAQMVAMSVIKTVGTHELLRDWREPRYDLGVSSV
jgi:hypothetical protein